LVRDQISDNVSGYIGKCTFGRINCKFKTSREKNTSQYTIYWYNGEDMDLKVFVVLLLLLLSL